MTEDDKVRAAGVRKEDRLLGMSSAEVVQATKSREIQSTYRVFCLEPVVIGRFHSQDSAEAIFMRKYEGRVREWSIEPPSNYSTKWTLTVTLWTVGAEFKTEELADGYVMEQVEAGRDPATIMSVARNSRQEHVLAQYGVLKLPA